VGTVRGTKGRKKKNSSEAQLSVTSKGTKTKGSKGKSEIKKTAQGQETRPRNTYTRLPRGATGWGRAKRLKRKIALRDASE